MGNKYLEDELLQKFFDHMNKKDKISKSKLLKIWEKVKKILGKMFYILIIGILIVIFLMFLVFDIKKIVGFLRPKAF